MPFNDRLRCRVDDQTSTDYLKCEELVFIVIHNYQEEPS